jgi:glycosyltransferase involved in cell wall biosynthesis
VVADAELESWVHPFFAETVRVRQAIDIAAYRPAPPAVAVTAPLVVHAPSLAIQKGTPAVLATIAQLQPRYRFEFQLVENTPHHQALDIYRRADIIIDQLTIGTHGLLAVEGMALAKPVVCFIDPAWRSGYPAELPLVSAGADSLTEQLATLLGDGAQRRRLGEAGRAYVERYHDARVVAEALRGLYARLR